MELYTLDDLNLNEINTLLLALNYIEIKGKDAGFLYNLQSKIHNQIIEIQNHIKEEQIKQQEAPQLIEEEKPKRGRKSS